MPNVDNLRAELAAYDGRSPTILSELSARHRSDADFLSDLVRFVSDATPVISEGATWIIKAELEAGQTLSPHDVQRLIRALDGVTAWQAQLHICQSLRYIPVQQDQTGELETWLNGMLDAPRPFLRAWAVDALCKVHGPSAQTMALLLQMETDKAASVRARVRNLKKDLGIG